MSRLLRSLALLVSVQGAASICSAHAITWALNGTFNDGGTVSGTFVFDPDLGPNQRLSTFNIAVSGGNTSIFFPFDFTPANSVGASDAAGSGSQLAFLSNATFVGGESYVVQFLTVSALSDAGGVVNINLTSPSTANCFNCDPFRLFVSGTVTATPPLPATPAPPTLLLMLIGLGCVVLYAARHRLHRAFAGSEM